MTSFFHFWHAIFSLAFMRLHFGGSSKSSSSNTTNNMDNRVAVSDGIGLSSSNSNTISTTNNTAFFETDHGAVKDALNFGGATVDRALDTVDFGRATVDRALDTVELSTANLGAGYQSLIDAADSLFQRGESMIGQTQQHVADAYRNAETDKGGALDQKTIIILAAVGVVGLFAFKKG